VRLVNAKMVIMMTEVIQYVFHLVTHVPIVQILPLIVLNVLQELAEGFLLVALVIQVFMKTGLLVRLVITLFVLLAIPTQQLALFLVKLDVLLVILAEIVFLAQMENL